MHGCGWWSTTWSRRGGRKVNSPKPGDSSRLEISKAVSAPSRSGVGPSYDAQMQDISDHLGLYSVCILSRLHRGTWANPFYVSLKACGRNPSVHLP